MGPEQPPQQPRGFRSHAVRGSGAGRRVSDIGGPFHSGADSPFQEGKQLCIRDRSRMVTMPAPAVAGLNMARVLVWVWVRARVCAGAGVAASDLAQ